ncbi:RxLR effector protein SFI6 [Phytophthora ramorum]|uniref:RxLR effector protein SFI6 n=1 Tax=Phytophthora ramorum TaxID=164328 RepID=UPI00309569DF|nr:RxLR effector protein SFI6 [Phytophthora ramorum]
MRLSYVLLVATATTLLTSGNALSAATNADQTADISTMGSPDSVTSLEIGNGAGDEKRFLRSHRAEEDDDDSNEDDKNDEDDEDEEEEEEEERASGTNLFSATKLDDMLRKSSYRVKRFKKWKGLGYTPIKVQSKMGNDLYQKYRHWYYHGPGARRN